MQRLQREGRVVAMAAEAINDALARDKADSVAIGTSTDVAMSCAQVTLVRAICGLVRVRTISEETIVNMKRNLGFAFVVPCSVPTTASCQKVDRPPAATYNPAHGPVSRVEQNHQPFADWCAAVRAICGGRLRLPEPVGHESDGGRQRDVVDGNDQPADG